MPANLDVLLNRMLNEADGKSDSQTAPEGGGRSTLAPRRESVISRTLSPSCGRAYQRMDGIRATPSRIRPTRSGSGAPRTPLSIRTTS